MEVHGRRLTTSRGRCAAHARRARLQCVIRPFRTAMPQKSAKKPALPVRRAVAAAERSPPKTSRAADDLFDAVEKNVGGAQPKVSGARRANATPPRKGGGEDGYTAADIEVLEGLEPVRRRPGMYIGGTDEKGLHHLFAEVIDNSMDEAVAGHATWIEVELSGDGFVAVTDNGRGMPVDPHPKFKDKSALEVI